MKEEMNSQPVSPIFPADGQRAELYHALGGMDTCRRLATAFYAHVEYDPILRPLYPPTLKGCPVNALAAFFIQFFGGPCAYTSRRWNLSLREFHLRFAIGLKEREAWLTDMFLALDDLKIQEPVHGALRWFFVQASAYFMNQPCGATDGFLTLQECHEGDQAEEEMSHTVGDQARREAFRLHQEIKARWQAQRMLEEVVEAAHQGKAEVVLAMIETSVMQAFFARDRGACLSLFVILSCSHHPALVGYARRKLVATPGMVHERYTSDLTLLHALAGQGNLAMVELLLQMGADPNVQNYLGQTPLYWVGNGSPGVDGAEVVHVLVRHGAHVNAQEKLKHCTPLHMAARRGNIAVAAALLDCGAEREALDKLGETPLHRAVRCAKVEMVAFLLARGANVRARGKRGLTPRQVARGDAMKRLLQSSRENGATGQEENSLGERIDDKGYHDRGVLDRLGIQPGQAVACANAVGDIAPDLPQSILERTGRPLASENVALDLVLAVVTETADAVALLTTWRPRIKPAGGIWLLTAKRGQPGYVDQQELIAAGKQAVMVDNKVCSVSSTVSAMRFVIRIKDRRA